MIEDIKCFNLELHVPLIAEMVVLSNRQVALYFTKPAHQIPRRIALFRKAGQSESGVRGVCTAIEDAPARVLRAPQVERATRIEVDPAVIGAPGHRIEQKIAQQINRETTPRDKLSISAPALQKPSFAKEPVFCGRGAPR